MRALALHVLPSGGIRDKSDEDHMPARTTSIIPNLVDPIVETGEPSSPRPTKTERENKAFRGRGSLYEADMKEKERRLRQQERMSTYYSVGDRGTREFHY